MVGLSGAIDDFRRARFRAKLEQILARLTGQSSDLLEYEEVQKKLRATTKIPRGLQDIPIEAIVGSVGRYGDFTRSFLPRQDEDEGRWVGVKLAMTDLVGLPPIEVYQIGEVYFVLDGNHRVSVARQLGATHIQAYVSEVQTKVSLSPGVKLDDLILKAELADFLAHTRLDRLRPGSDLSVSLPGQYQKLEGHISVHQYFMGIDLKRDIPYRDAVAHWYDTVYLPVAQMIRERGILRDFPGRTEADLYLWIMEHRVALGKELHWEIELEEAATDLADRYSPRPQRVVARVGGAISQAVVPQTIVSGPPPGAWRQERDVGYRSDRLFSSILVAVGGRDGGQSAVDQALQVARRENGRLIGLHIVSAEADRESEMVDAMRDRFLARCASAGVPGRWSVKAGSIASKICELSRWISLTVVDLAHPPEDQPAARLSSGFRTLIQKCPTPILAVPGVSSEMRRVLLAYDGSPKANEALFVSTYLAGQWGVSLTVVTVIEEERTASATLARAHKYLEEHGVGATFVTAHGPVGEAILNVAREHSSELVVMGGYGFSPVLQIVFGSAVDQVLRGSSQPVLICR
jgi:nucleotide-binding universal stress UspA family protein